MAENIVLNNVASFTNDTTAVNTVNGNNATITAAFTDVLSRSGVSPNQMTSNLDMNNNQIMNLPAPGSVNSPARLIDVVSNPTITVPPTGTSGAVVGFLNGNNTVSGNNTYTGTNTFNNTVTLPSTVAGTPTFTGLTTFSNASGISIAPASGSASILVNPTQAAQTASITFEQTGTAEWTMGKDGSNNFFVFDNVGSRNVATCTTADGSFRIRGTTTNNSAAAGFVGEYVSSTVTSGSAITLGTGTPSNITSISLTAGDWDVWGISYFNPGATTNLTNLQTSISTTSATINNSPGNWAVYSQAAAVPNGQNCLDAGPLRLSLASTTTVFLVAQATFTVSSMAAYGIIQARRRT